MCIKISDKRPKQAKKRANRIANYLITGRKSDNVKYIDKSKIALANAGYGGRMPLPQNVADRMAKLKGGKYQL